jgi:ribosomal protein S21
MLEWWHEWHLAARICFYGDGTPGASQQQEEGFLAYVVLRDGEDGEGLLKRFQSSIQRGGIMRELRNRRFFRTKGEQSRIDKARAIRRARRRRRRR